MRRARAGVRNLKRPIGSFLFLGPTGVGKTETAKALAAAFFGDEKAMMRLDMSEYQTADALSKLTGSFIGGKAGVLSSMLREKPYGVLLLDEFEKTNKDVMNLFLQILDEGFFSDMHGKRVNARNVIFIATSNAGSELIWNAVKERHQRFGAHNGGWH
jgi:ATP-dependent Clp protease ATP-binding subunit ClpC